MEIVLIRHGQPKWVDGDQYDLNPGLTELGKIQADKSASIFSENSFNGDTHSSSKLFSENIEADLSAWIFPSSVKPGLRSY